MLKQKEWIETLVNKIGCTKAEAKVYYDCVFDYLKEQLSPEEQIKIAGFGVLKLRKTAAKEQINLVTGQAEVVPEHNVITFKPYFDIDPKPEAIEVEYEDVIVEETPVVAEEETVEEEVVEETPAEEEAKEEPAQEEAAQEEAVQEEAKEEPVAEEPAKEEEAPVEEEDNVVWVYEGKQCSTSNIKQLLKQKTPLSEKDIVSALNVVKEKLKLAGKSTCEIKENEDSFDVIFAK